MARLFFFSGMNVYSLPCLDRCSKSDEIVDSLRAMVHIDYFSILETDAHHNSSNHSLFFSPSLFDREDEFIDDPYVVKSENAPFDEGV